jgi:hypothetical protein
VGSCQEENLRAALLLEQAALCLLRVSPPSVRKYAFHMVLAGLRYNACDQKALGMRAYRCSSTSLVMAEITFMGVEITKLVSLLWVFSGSHALLEGCHHTSACAEACLLLMMPISLSDPLAVLFSSALVLLDVPGS